MTTLDAALYYIDQGWSPIPVPHREKNPGAHGLKEWQKLRITKDAAPQHFNCKPQNIGVLLGEPSNGLVDVDLDHEAALALADKYLPHTPAVFGRKGNPRSHRLYIVTGNIESEKWNLPGTKDCVVEIRSTGGQTVFPPSTHESGEDIEWDKLNAQPTFIEPHELQDAVQRLYYAALNKLGIKPQAEPQAAERSQRTNDGGLTPGNDYIARTNWRDILTARGWTIDHEAGGVTYWHIPGSDHKWGATTNYGGIDQLYTFTERTGLKEKESYSRFAAFTFWEHGGDFPAAAKALAAQGYGARAQYNDLDDYGIPRDEQKGPKREWRQDPDTGVYTNRPAAPEKPTRPPIEKFSIGDLQDKYPTMHTPVIQEVCREGETFNIVSNSKIGKSWLMYYIMLCVVTGRMIFDRFATVPGNVLLIDNELHRPTIASRFKIVAKAMGIELVQYADKIDVWPLRGNLRNIYELTTEFDGIEPGAYSLIGLDAKYRMIGEDASENDNGAETRFYNAVDQLADKTRAAIGLVLHATKGSQSDKRITDVGAGAGAQSRACDSHLVLREHEEDDAVVLAAAVRSFAPIEPFCLRWNFPLWEPDDTLDAGALKGKKTPGEEKQGERDAEADEAILKQCQTWCSRKQIRDRTGFSEQRVNRAICRLVEGKYLEQQEEIRRGQPCDTFRKTMNAR